MCVLFKICLYYYSLWFYRYKYSFLECCSLTAKQNKSWELDLEHRLCQGACETRYRAGTNVALLPEPTWVQKHCVPAQHRAGAVVLISLWTHASNYPALHPWT